MSALRQLSTRFVALFVLFSCSSSLYSEVVEIVTSTGAKVVVKMETSEALQTYLFESSAILRDHLPAEKQVVVEEHPSQARTRTGSPLFDGLYAMAVEESLLNSVDKISDGAYAQGDRISIQAFQTGEKWSFVWTRDLAYSLYLSLSAFDPQRAQSSLLFKASKLKSGVEGPVGYQIIQDTGSGGSYPVSTDRVTWALGAHETMKYLSARERRNFLKEVYPIFRDTIEQDRQLVFDERDGLYRGEHSFLDWREQTYPGWTRDNVLAVGMSKAFSVNALNYFLLDTASDYAQVMGEPDLGAKYEAWAKDLKAAINEHFYDADAGLYRTYLLSLDGTCYMPVDRYDLLGQSLAILLGVADSGRAARVIASYPSGPHGPPVIWPEVLDVPIYHNQGIWPFVTAFWTKAAKQAGNAEAVNAGIRSLMDLSAANLSNMENFDFVTGQAHVTEGDRQGPVINSRRQLWSVAGYLSMVQDVVFGLETNLQGIRFQPFVTAELRNGLFAGQSHIRLLDFEYRGTSNEVRVHLPEIGPSAGGVCRVVRISLNGKAVPADFIAWEQLHLNNTWDIYLEVPSDVEPEAGIRLVDVTSERAIFGPLQPEWDEARGAIVVSDGKLKLQYTHPDLAAVSFNIYRDGALYAEDVRSSEWIDPDSADYHDRVHTYSIEAFFPESGNVSHPTRPRAYRTLDQVLKLPASEMSHVGGNLVDEHHFENWGRPEHVLTSRPFAVDRSGRYQVRAEFSNGSGPVNTGITCAVKRIEVFDTEGELVRGAYLMMPQSSDWGRWDWSNAIPVDLKAGEVYTARIFEDAYSRNMSYFKKNELYTLSTGGGPEPYNYVNIASLQVAFLEQTE